MSCASAQHSHVEPHAAQELRSRAAELLDSRARAHDQLDGLRSRLATESSRADASLAEVAAAREHAAALERRLARAREGGQEIAGAAEGLHAELQDASASPGESMPFPIVRLPQQLAGRGRAASIQWQTCAPAGLAGLQQAVLHVSPHTCLDKLHSKLHNNCLPQIACLPYPCRASRTAGAGGAASRRGCG